jgi:hypothetical protein
MNLSFIKKVVYPWGKNPELKLESRKPGADRDPVTNNHLLQVAILDLIGGTGSVQAAIDIRSEIQNGADNPE